MELNGDCQKYSQSYDVVLKVGNKTFYLEKETLREKCAYFEAMFSGKFAEDSQQEVAIEMISATSMTFVVDYLYNRVVEIDDLSIVEELIEAAMFFQLAELVDSIVEILKAKISLTTWAKVLQIAKVFNLSDLERKARCFGLFHFDHIRKNIDCVDNVVTLHWYLSNAYLKVNHEYDIFETGCDWMRLNNIDSKNSILVILSCLDYKTLDKVSLEKILESDVVNGNDLARQVIKSIMEINSGELECVTPKACASFLQNVDKSVSDIVIGFLTSVKERACMEQPCVIRKRKDTHLKKFNPKINELVNWLEISNKDMWGHNLVVWRGFHIILLCGETCMGKNIWNKNILKYSILEEKWTRLNSVPVVPRRHAAAVIHEDSLYIIGGVDSFRITLASVRRYDLLHDTWHALPDIPEFCQTPVATFHNGELYVSATMLYVFRNNQWVHLFKTSMRHNTIISFRDRLYFSQNWSNCLNCWDTESLIEYMRPNEQLSKKSNYNITSMCLLGKSMYLLTEPEHFDKQAYYMERCHLEESSLETEILMEKVACSDYPFNSSECLVIPNLDLEDRSINDFGKRWLDAEDFSNDIINLGAEGDCSKTNCVLKVINSD